MSSTPVAIIAKDFGISESAIYRWRASSLGKSTIQTHSDKARVLDYVEVAAESLRDADAVRRQGVETNNANLVLKSSMVINHLTRTISMYLGVDGSNTATLLADGDAVVNALVQVIRDAPGVATDMVLNLRKQGQFELAGEFEDLARSLEETKNQELTS
ncbi:hypothetical protein ABS642_01045 [Microbacterium sp. A8/3-1]|uniref:Terminase small subunit n=1 Tax=Microbacterium sp. A8/3-1 TaxID=3160749 RepID=A0AAU7VZR8_9MICO